MGTRNLPSRSRKPFALPDLDGSLIPRKISGMRVCSPASLNADKAAMVCIKVSAVPPDLEIATKRVVACGSLASSVSKAVRIEIVDEMQLRRRPQRADPRNGKPGKLRQSLAAEAGAAGAENDDIGCPVRQLACGIADRLQIGVRFRQAQQRQSAIGMPGPESWSSAPSARAKAAFSTSAPMPCDPIRSSRALSIDWTMFMLGISLESRKRRNGGNQRERYSVVPLDVSPFGLPAIVTNKPPPYRRFATRLASSIVTASIKALRR